MIRFTVLCGKKISNKYRISFLNGQQTPIISLWLISSAHFHTKNTHDLIDVSHLKKS